MKDNMTAVATELITNGFSVIPTKADKSPAIHEVTPYQKRCMTQEERKSAFRNGHGIGVICGQISGNTECLDIDDPELVAPFLNILRQRKPALAAKLVKQETLHPGRRHLIYRCQTAVGGNTKLATSRPYKKNGQIKQDTWIETRGEGGYFISAPTKGYTLLENSLKDIPTLTADEVHLLHTIAKSFTAQPKEPKFTRKATVNGTRPGDDYRSRHDPSEILPKYGWKPTGKNGQGGQHWTRPGKDKGTSATLKDGCLYVFSSSTVLPMGPNDTFSIYAHYRHNGDFSAAAKALVKEGYGCREDHRSTEKNGSTESVADPMDAIINTCVEKEYVTMLGDERWLFEDLIIKNQITVIIAKSGGGKTTITFDFVAPRIIKNHGVKVFFMDCDSPTSDHKRMFKIAKRNGSSFYWLNPITQGKNADYLIENLKKMVEQKTRLDNVVIFMDTLKKFLNVMSKNSTKPFYELLRQMISLGATIVLLGHANKYRDSEGNLVFEGVGDILSDADALIYFESVKAIGGGDDVTTVVERDKGAKVRGLYKPISFHISGYDRTVTQHETVVPIPDYSPEGRKERLSDDQVMDEVRNLLQNKTGRMNQSNIVDALKGKPGIAYQHLLRVLKSQVVLDKNAFGTGTVYFFNGERGTKFYDVVE